MNIKKNILYRVYLIFFVMVVLGVAIVGKAYKIQTQNNGYWAALADSLSTDLISIEAERGNIYSADGALLATSLPYFELRVDFASPAMTKQIFDENVEALSEKMAEKFGTKTAYQYKQELVRARSRGSRYYLLKRRVDYNELSKIKQWPLFSEGKYKGGLIVITKQSRQLPYGYLAKRTIGYQRENAQSVGLEGQYNEYLSGKQGERLMQRIAGGTWIPLTDENAIDPENGKDIYTTINVNLQDLAETALLRALETHNAKHGCVVVMEVETGYIKAIANLGQTKSGKYDEIYNYAVGRKTEPGSTFKAASMLAMLEDGLVHPDDTVNVNHGHSMFYGRHMYDAGGWTKYENLPAWKAFSTSSNVGLAKLTNKAYRNKKLDLYKKLQQYNLTDKTEVPISGEPTPTIKNPEKDAWMKTYIPWMSTGYSIELTPLQTLAFYNAIANDGKMVKPQLVDRVVEMGKEVKVFKTEVIEKRISSEKAIDQLRGMMEKVVEEGTARNIKSEHYAIAGKTGTSKIFDTREGAYVKRYRASFAGYFPADAPKYSCIVFIEEPRNGKTHGGSVAAPVFKEIADKVMAADLEMQQPFNDGENLTYLTDNSFSTSLGNYERLAKTFNLELQQLDNVDFVQAKVDDKGKSKLKTLAMKENLVPNVTGMTIDEALFILENAGLKVKFQGAGKVKKQSVDAGEKIIKNATIHLELS